MRQLVKLSLLGLLLFGADCVFAQKADEYKIKAQLMARFLKFVEWPKSVFADDTVIIRVIGKDPSDEFFESILDKRYKGRRLEVRRHRKYREGMVVDDCHLLFISRSEKRHTEEILGRVRGLNILTVGETKGFVDEDGGMVNFIYVNKNIRFEVNQKVSNEMGLRIPSHILKYAVHVVRKNSE